MKIPLDGEWQFAVDSTGAFRAADVKTKAEWRPTRVPMSWTLEFPELRDYQGTAWYRKVFKPGVTLREQSMLLRFDAVDYLAEVYFNGTRLGTHEGGYTPFEFDVTRLLRQGENEILVRVTDPGPTPKEKGGLSYLNIPHGKQSWYVQTSGIWQSVHADVVSRRRVASAKITPAMDGTVNFALRFAGSGGGSIRLSVRILDPHSWEVAHMSRMVGAGTESVRLQLKVKTPMAWSPAIPNLYVAEIQMEGADGMSERFGFRSLEARNRQLLLNGEPFFMIGALDQDFYPETGYTTPSEDVLRDEMAKAKRMGLNTLRCHIKVPDPRYLKVADEMGLLVWYEIPNWDVFTPEAGRRAMQTLDEMLERDWNHPSLVVLSIINESWGLDLSKADQRAWLKESFNEAKKKAAGRLVVDNSACFGNFHMKTDINDYHIYYSIPENREKFDRAVQEMAGRPAWLFSTHGDAEESGREPLVLSEFGNWGLPEIPNPHPWWMNRPFGDAEVVLPEGFAGRFVRHDLESVFGNLELFADRSQAAQMAALKYEVEQLRLTPQIQGYIITEFTDLHWESNGLLDMWRRVKIAGRGLSTVQQSDVIIPRPLKYTFWNDEQIDLRLWLSHYGKDELEGGTMTWATSTGEHGSMPLIRQERGTVRELPPIRIPAFPVTSPQSMRITFTCQSGNGVALTENSCDVYVFPRPDSSTAAAAALHDPEKRLGALTPTFGLREPAEASEPGLTITSCLDRQVLERLGAGETVLCLADTTTDVPKDFPLRIMRRDTAGWYDGNWASSLSWVRKSRPPFNEVNFGPVMGFETTSMGLPMVIGGVKPEDFTDVLAGMFVGWVRLNAAYVVQLRAGKGKLVLCTLPLAAECGRDPYATTVLGALIRYCARQDLTPGIVWDIHHQGGGL